MKARHIPNMLCVLRLLLVGPVVWLLFEGYYWTALAIFAFAGFTDGLDGFLAKRYHWESRLGGILDPLADKLLLVSVFLTLGIIGLVPGWLILAVVLRDVIIVSGAIGYRVFIGRYEAEPTHISKLNTGVQLLYVVAVVGAAAQGGVPAAVIDGLGYGVLASTVASGTDYVVSWGLRAWRARRQHAGE